MQEKCDDCAAATAEAVASNPPPRRTSRRCAAATHQTQSGQEGAGGAVFSAALRDWADPRQASDARKRRAVAANGATTVESHAAAAYAATMTTNEKMDAAVQQRMANVSRRSFPRGETRRSAAEDVASVDAGENGLIASVGGSPTKVAAIVARALRVPAVAATVGFMQRKAKRAASQTTRRQTKSEILSTIQTDVRAHELKNAFITVFRDAKRSISGANNSRLEQELETFAAARRRSAGRRRSSVPHWDWMNDNSILEKVLVRGEAHLAKIAGPDWKSLDDASSLIDGHWTEAAEGVFDDLSIPPIDRLHIGLALKEALRLVSTSNPARMPPTFFVKPIRVRRAKAVKDATVRSPEVVEVARAQWDFLKKDFHDTFEYEGFEFFCGSAYIQGDNPFPSQPPDKPLLWDPPLIRTTAQYRTYMRNGELVWLSSSSASDLNCDQLFEAMARAEYPIESDPLRLSGMPIHELRAAVVAALQRVTMKHWGDGGKTIAKWGTAIGCLDPIYQPHRFRSPSDELYTHHMQPTTALFATVAETTADTKVMTQMFARDVIEFPASGMSLFPRTALQHNDIVEGGAALLRERKRVARTSTKRPRVSTPVPQVSTSVDVRLDAHARSSCGMYNYFAFMLSFLDTASVHSCAAASQELRQCSIAVEKVHVRTGALASIGRHEWLRVLDFCFGAEPNDRADFVTIARLSVASRWCVRARGDACGRIEFGLRTCIGDIAHLQKTYGNKSGNAEFGDIASYIRSSDRGDFMKCFLAEPRSATSDAGRFCSAGNNLASEKSYAEVSVKEGGPDAAMWSADCTSLGFIPELRNKDANKSKVLDHLQGVQCAPCVFLGNESNLTDPRICLLEAYGDTMHGTGELGGKTVLQALARETVEMEKRLRDVFEGTLELTHDKGVPPHRGRTFLNSEKMRNCDRILLTLRCLTPQPLAGLGRFGDTAVTGFNPTTRATDLVQMFALIDLRRMLYAKVADARSLGAIWEIGSGIIAFAIAVEENWGEGSIKPGRRKPRLRGGNTRQSKYITGLCDFLYSSRLFAPISANCERYEAEFASKCKALLNKSSKRWGEPLLEMLHHTMHAHEIHSAVNTGTPRADANVVIKKMFEALPNAPKEVRPGVVEREHIEKHTRSSIFIIGILASRADFVVGHNVGLTVWWENDTSFSSLGSCATTLIIDRNATVGAQQFGGDFMNRPMLRVAMRSVVKRVLDHPDWEFPGWRTVGEMLNYLLQVVVNGGKSGDAIGEFLDEVGVESAACLSTPWHAVVAAAKLVDIAEPLPDAAGAGEEEGEEERGRGCGRRQRRKQGQGFDRARDRERAAAEALAVVQEEERAVATELGERCRGEELVGSCLWAPVLGVPSGSSAWEKVYVKGFTTDSEREHPYDIVHLWSATKTAGTAEEWVATDFKNCLVASIAV